MYIIQVIISKKISIKISKSIELKHLTKRLNFINLLQEKSNVLT